MLTQAQLNKRREYIGGSEVAAILGTDANGKRIDPFKTALQVYCEKKGESNPFRGNDATLAGQILEKGILEIYDALHATTKRQHLSDDELEFTHPEFPFMCCHPDGLDEEWSVLEVKNVGERSAREWPRNPCEIDKVPKRHLIQLLYNMGIVASTGKPVQKGYLIAFFGGNDVRVFTLPFDEKRSQLLLNKVKSFWQNHVLEGVPPQACTLSDVTDFVPVREGVPVEASPSVLEDVAQLRTLTQEKKEIDEKIESLKTNIATFMGERDTLLDQQNNICVSFKQQKRTSVNVAALKDAKLYDGYTQVTSTRVFKLLATKNGEKND